MRPVISRRHMYLVLTLLMPLLTLRALLPAGYMVSADGHGPRIVLCSEGMAGWKAASEDSRHDQLPDASPDCVFAHAAVHAPPPQVVVRDFAPLLLARFVSLSFAELPPATGPPRQYGARGPPSYFL
jgi:hypothetical protein